VLKYSSEDAKAVLYGFRRTAAKKSRTALRKSEKGEQEMNKKIKTEAVDHLFEAVLTLESPEECYAFFEDVCTVNELLSLSQRYEVARMLRDKKTYLEIADKTGASTATISRVNRSLNYGNDGYDMVFARLGGKTEGGT
jgi:TrpR-related protein YerC/YecD